MKQKVMNVLLGGALLLSAPLFTSCEDILGKWDRPTPASGGSGGSSAAEGTYIVYTAPGTSSNVAIPSTATAWNFTSGNVPAGTYYVEGSFTSTGALALRGDVNLILKDGATLTIQNGIAGWEDPDTPGGNLTYSLNVYAQSAGTSMGKLIVNNDTPVSGEAYAIRVKSMTVHGGQIDATGNTSNAAATSGVAFEVKEKLTVYDGVVNMTAEGTAMACYTWGGGTDALEFYDGTIKAIGGDGLNPTVSASTVTIASTITKLELTNTAATTLNGFIGVNTALTIGGTDVTTDWGTATTTTIPTTWPITPTYDGTSKTLTLQPYIA